MHLTGITVSMATTGQCSHTAPEMLENLSAHMLALISTNYNLTYEYLVYLITFSYVLIYINK